jgi:hypothetical protein
MRAKADGFVAGRAVSADRRAFWRQLLEQAHRLKKSEAVWLGLQKLPNGFGG